MSDDLACLRCASDHVVAVDEDPWSVLMLCEDCGWAFSVRAGPMIETVRSPYLCG